jgi:hypothetical protein
VKTRSFLTALVGVWLAAVVTSAEAPIQLSIHDGRVWLTATNATVRQILSEWARVGRTIVVNGERIPGGPVALQLDGVPEQEALDVLLRSTGGFMAASRAVPVADASRFDRVIILPTSAAPKADTTRAAAPVFAAPRPAYLPSPAVASTPGVQHVIGADGLPVPDDQDDAQGDASSRSPLPPLPAGADQPDVRPAPAMRPFPTPNAAPTIPAGVAVPGTIVPPPRASSPPAPRNQ